MAPIIQRSASKLYSLVEDIVILIISFLEPPAIITLSQTCRRLHDFTRLRIVWTNACNHHVLARGYIFPSTPPISEMSTAQLRFRVLHAYGLSTRWVDAQRSNEVDAQGDERGQRTRTGDLHPRSCTYVTQTAGMSLSEVRFLPYTIPESPSGSHHLVVTLGKSVWSVLSVWSVITHGRGDGEQSSSKKVAEWGPRGAIFTGFVVNDVSDSEATIAISFQLHEQYFVKLLSVSSDQAADINSDVYDITELHTMRTSFVPKTLSGNLLVLADDDAWVEVWDWHAGTCAVLEHIDGQRTIQTNECLQVFLSPESNSIIVARARSMHIFPWPHLTQDASGNSGNLHVSVDTNPSIYRPFASQSFGWVDGMAVNIRPMQTGVHQSQATGDSRPVPAFDILVRGESDDPWSNDVQRLQLWTLVPNPEYFTSLHWDSTSPGAKQSPSLSRSSRKLPASDDASISASSTSASSSTPDQASFAPHAHASTSAAVSRSVSLSPYIFPPTLTATIPCLHGALRCKQVALGRFGTAVWIRPPARQGWGTGDWENPSRAYAGDADLGLTVLTEDVSSAGGGTAMLPSVLGSRSAHGQTRDPNADSEVLVGVPLNQEWDCEKGPWAPDRWQDSDYPAQVPPERRQGLVRAIPIFANDAATGWSAFDYDEIHGRVVLANSFGRVVVLEL